MWVVDQDKERERNYLRNDVSGLINRLTQQLTAVDQVVSELSYTTSGAPSGLGDSMVDDCRRAQNEISQALQEIQASKSCVDSLETRVWVDDDNDF